MSLHALLLLLSLLFPPQYTVGMHTGATASSGGGGGSYTVVQEGPTTCHADGATTVACAFPSAVTAHDTIIVLTLTGGNFATGQISLATDNSSDTFTNAVLNDGSASDNAGARIDYVSNATGGSTTVTCHATTGINIHCHIWEVSGTLTSGSFDQSGTNTQTNTALTVSTGAATAQATEFMIAGFVTNDDGYTYTAGSGWSPTLYTTNGSGNDAAFSEAKTSSSAAVQTATATVSTSSHNACVIATFR